jgi:hypothetical protein
MEIIKSSTFDYGYVIAQTYIILRQQYLDVGESPAEKAGRHTEDGKK